MPRIQQAAVIITPSTLIHDRSTKRDIYAREGIAHYWIVDPVEQLMEVFALLDGQWTLAAAAKDSTSSLSHPSRNFGSISEGSGHRHSP